MRENKGMPKIQIITDPKSIKKYGGDRMYFAPPLEYDRVMKSVPNGKIITIGRIREYFAKLGNADFTDPITAGIFVSIVAWASEQRQEDKTPYWRTLKADGRAKPKISRRAASAKSKTGSGRAQNHPAGTDKYPILCRSV